MQGLASLLTQVRSCEDYLCVAISLEQPVNGALIFVCLFPCSVRPKIMSWISNRAPTAHCSLLISVILLIFSTKSLNLSQNSQTRRQIQYLLSRVPRNLRLPHVLFVQIKCASLDAHKSIICCFYNMCKIWQIHSWFMTNSPM